jgi:fructose-1,6-bisphosphatase/inositol monophosphatase family enzyme
MLGEEDLDPAFGPHPGRVWVLCPVDGTHLLADGIPLSVVSLALVEDGLPVLGIVHDPHTGRTLTAIRGGGAFCDGIPLHVSASPALCGVRLALPGGPVPGLDTARLLAAAIDAGADLVTTGSAVYDGTLVALGHAAGYVYPYQGPWDVAALAVLVTEAGGRVTDLRGRSQRYDARVHGAIASNGIVHDELVRIVVDHLAMVT